MMIFSLESENSSPPPLFSLLVPYLLEVMGDFFVILNLKSLNLSFFLISCFSFSIKLFFFHVYLGFPSFSFFIVIVADMLRVFCHRLVLVYSSVVDDWLLCRVLH